MHKLLHIALISVLLTLALLSIPPLVAAQDEQPAAFIPYVEAAVAGKNYYVDCNAGNDSNSGLAENAAWRSLWKTNRASLVPGDKLFLRRGCVWTGPLNLSWRGTGSQPIVIGSYGSGEYPIIDNAQYAVVISGINMIIQNLHARGAAQSSDPGCQNQPKGWAIGFRFEPTAAYNTLRYARATGLTHGVKVTRGANHNRIIMNAFLDNRLMFILDASNPSNDAGANGIVLEGDDNEIAYNEISGHDACSFDYGRDGSAIEVYGGQRNTIHHNRAFNNNTFSELGDPRSADNTYAYNLVVASIAKAHFLVTEGASGSRGPIARTKVYNNSVYLSDPTSVGVNCDGGCTSAILTLKNNIIWSEGRAIYTDTRADEGNNLYWKADGNPGVFFPTPAEMSSSSKRADPLFVDAARSNFRLRSGSPAIDMATNDAFHRGYTADLDGVPVPQRGAVDAGAYELR